MKCLRSQEGLVETAGSEVEHEGEPEMMVGRKGEREVPHPKEKGGGQGQGIEHVARGRGTDIDAVPHESGEAAKRNEQDPREIGRGGLDDSGIVGKQGKQGMTADGIERREEQRHATGPKEELANTETLTGGVLSTDILAHQGLAGQGKTVAEVTEQNEELDKQGVDRQQHVALSCTETGEGGGDGNEADHA